MGCHGNDLLGMAMTGKVVPMTGYNGYKMLQTPDFKGKEWKSSKAACLGATRQAPTFAIQCPGGHGLGGCASCAP